MSHCLPQKWSLQHHAQEKGCWVHARWEYRLEKVVEICPEDIDTIPQEDELEYE
jgi:hypothetical protein